MHSVTADAMPAYEVTSLTPDVYEEHADGSRTPVSVSMENCREAPRGRAQVEKVLALYGQWIAERAGVDSRTFPIATTTPPIGTWTCAPKRLSGWRRAGSSFSRTRWQRAPSNSRTRRCSTSRCGRDLPIRDVVQGQ